MLLKLGTRSTASHIVTLAGRDFRKNATRIVVGMPSELHRSTHGPGRKFVRPRQPGAGNAHNFGDGGASGSGRGRKSKLANGVVRDFSDLADRIVAESAGRTVAALALRARLGPIGRQIGSSSRR